MPGSEYLVTTACYVPVGEGLKFKQPGQVVTLYKKDANKLDGYIKPLEGASSKSTTKQAKETEASTRDPYTDRLQNSDVVGPPLDTPREESDAG